MEISTASARIVISPSAWGPLAGAVVRSGSPRFVHGPSGRACLGLVALARADRGQTRFRWRRVTVVATIEERVGAAEAIRRGLFTLREAKVRGYDLELAPDAEPRLPVPVFWLGRSFGDRQAVRAIEHYDRYDPRGDGNRLYIAFYSRPGEGGTSNALPGSSSPPPSELQVTSSSASAPLARRTIAHLERAHRRHGWPRLQVKTATGDTAVVYLNLGEGRPFTNFSVVVDRTLVGVIAARGLTEDEARAIASRLRPRA